MRLDCGNIVAPQRGLIQDGATEEQTLWLGHEAVVLASNERDICRRIRVCRCLVRECLHVMLKPVRKIRRLGYNAANKIT